MLKHQHIIIWAQIQNPPSSDQVEEINDWFRQLVKAIGMKILIDPRTVYCDMPGNRGMTGICAIETSHAALHIWDEGPAVLQFDLYTCSTLDKDIVFEKLARFKPTVIDWHFIDRDDDGPSKLQVKGTGRTYVQSNLFNNRCTCATGDGCSNYCD